MSNTAPKKLPTLRDSKDPEQLDIFQREVRESLRQVAQNNAEVTQNITNIFGGVGTVTSVSGTAPITVSPGTGDVVVGVNLSAYPAGNGTTNRLAKWTGTNSLGDSIVSDNGSTVTVSGGLAATGNTQMGDTAASDTHSIYGYTQLYGGTTFGLELVGAPMYNLMTSGDAAVQFNIWDASLPTTLDFLNSGGGGLTIGVNGNLSVTGNTNLGDGQLDLTYVTGTLQVNRGSGAAGIVVGDNSAKDWTFYLSGSDLRLFEYTTVFGTGGSDRVQFLSGGGQRLVSGSLYLNTAQGVQWTDNGVDYRGGVVVDSGGTMYLATNAGFGGAISRLELDGTTGLTSVKYGLALTGGLNANATAGSNGQILQVVGGLPKWDAPSAALIPTGTGSADRVTKWTGVNTLGIGLLIDDGIMPRSTKNASVARFAVGDDPYTASPGVNGVNLQAYSDGSNYFDSKSVSGGSTFFRCGHNTETGFARTWLTVTNSNGNAAFTGSVTLGDAPGSDTHTINGVTTIKAGSSSGLATALTGTVLVIDQANGTNNYLQFRSNTIAGLAWAGVGTGGDGKMVYDSSINAFQIATANTFRCAIMGDGSWRMGDTASSGVDSNVDVLTIGNTGTGQTSNNKALVKLTHTGSYDTTAAPLDTFGVYSTMTASRSAGANSLTTWAVRGDASGAPANVAVGGIASGSTINYAVYGNAAGGATNWSFFGAAGNIYNAGNLTIDGNTNLGNASSDIVTILGQVSATYSPTTTNSTTAFVVTNNGVYDTSAGNLTTQGLKTESLVTKAGADGNILTNRALVVNATGGSVNQAIYTQNGDCEFNTSSGVSNFNAAVTVKGNFTTEANTRIGNGSGDSVGFYTTAGTTQQTVTGSRGGNAALQSLLTALANLGLIVDSSS